MSKTDLTNLNSEESRRILDQLKASGALDEYLKKASEPTLFERLKKDKNERILQNNANCLLVLREDPLLRNAIRFNELTCRIDVVKDMGWLRNGIAFSDTDLDNIVLYMEENYHLHVEKQIERAIRIVANENRYHPIRQKLESIPWDGKERTAHALNHFLGVAESPLATRSLTLFLLGAISRIYQPGCKFEYMLCLTGGQGAGKSTFLRFLALEDDWFSDDIKRLDDDRIFQRLQGHWIMEMPEMLAVLNAKNVEETKSFISRQRDNYRTPYDKYASDHPRQCVFAGTSNRTQFLPMDKSGNRRFLPLEVHPENAAVHILEDERASRFYFEQLWAEAMVIYKSGDYKLTLSKDMNRQLLAAQENFIPEDPMEGAIRKYLEEVRPKYICVHQLYEKALGHYRTDLPQPWESILIGDIISQKFPQYKRISTHRFADYGRQRGWILSNEPSVSVFEPIVAESEKDLPFSQK